MEKSLKWSLAAKWGLILSLITVVVTLITTSFHDMPSWVRSTLTFVKLAAVIWVVLAFMKRYSNMCEGPVSYVMAFNFGFLMCFLSAIVCTVFAWVNFTFINPDFLQEATAMAMETLSTSLAAYADSVDLDKIEAMVPRIVVFSTFFNCLIFALIIPAVVASFAKKDIFVEE